LTKQVQPLGNYQNERRQGESQTKTIRTADANKSATLPQRCC